MPTVVHVLAVRRSESGPCDITATVREGDLAAGQSVWFTGVDGRRREIKVLSCREGRRFLRLEIDGAVEELGSGAYLYAD